MAYEANGYGGVLPVSDWPQADRAIEDAWGIHARLVDSAGGSSQDFVRGSVEQFSREIQSLSSRLEQFKHGPVPSDENAIRDWEKRLNDLPRWAGEIDKTADFTSTWGGVKVVVGESAKDLGNVAMDAARSAQKVGNIALFLIRNGPVLIVGGVLLYIAVVYGLPAYRKIRS